MKSLKCIILGLLVILCLNQVSWGEDRGFYEKVRVQCEFTTYPTLCVQTLTELGSGDPNIDFLTALVNDTMSQTNLPKTNFEILSSHFIPIQAQQERNALDYCEELMRMSRKRLNQASDALKMSPEKYKTDIQTWLSAAITFQQTCKDSVEGHVPSNSYMGEVYKKMEFLSESVSNSLALANRIGGNAAEKPPAGRRLRDFPRWVSAGERKLLQTTEIEANAVVAKDGSGDYETVAEAIAAAGGGRFVIYVKAGTYNEKINTNKDGITLIGDGKYSTVITAGGSVGKGSSLRGSATFTITGDGFIARDIGFQNTAGPNAEQAVALTTASDHSVLYRCSISSYQDTLYALSLRQFYRECDIHGTIDFVFGDAAAVFQSSTFYLRRPRSGGAYNVILANGRSDPGQNTGFSLHDCKITAASDHSPVRNSYKSYLGRPWKLYSRAVVMQSNIDGVIDSRGWVEWPGAGGETYKMLYFGEYGNMGGGAGTSGRVKWPGFSVMGKEEAGRFTVGSFIGGNSWLPATGVTFVSGL